MDENQPVQPESQKSKVESHIGTPTIKKGDAINVSQMDFGLKKMIVAAGWDVRGRDDKGIDVDLSLFLLDKNDQTRVDEDFVFYNNPTGCAGAVQHTGDNRTGAGDGDDETVFLDLQNIPFDVLRILFVLSVYDADMRDQNITHVENCFLRLVNQETGIELLRYQLDHEFTNKYATAAIVGELSREGPVWMFKAIGEEIEGGLSKIAKERGILVSGA